MNATGQQAPLIASHAYEETTEAVDARTLEILDRRRRTTIVKRRGWLMRRMLLLADIVGLVAAFLLADSIVEPPGGNGIGAPVEFVIFFLSLPGWIVVTKLYGLYDHDEERAGHSTADELAGVFHMVTVGVWLFFAFAYLTKVAHPELPKLLVFWALAIAFVAVGRASARAYSRRQMSYLQNTIIVGAGEVGQLLARKIFQHPEYGLNLVGFVDSAPKELRDDLGILRVLGPPTELEAFIRLFDVERVIIAFSRDRAEATRDLVRSLRLLDVQIDLVPRLFELVGPRIDNHAIEGFPLVGLAPPKIVRSSRLLKRAIDLAGAVVVLLFAAPFFAFAAWRIKRESSGPVLFRQTRLGAGMREFTALKFRTMRTGTPEDVHREFIRSAMNASAAPQSNGLYKLDRNADVTRFGAWLRRTSLDELPQLINVLRGEMSLVGPRPCIPYEVENFDQYHYERFLVPAGMTGLWQVTARAHSTFREALDLDVQYARGWSLWLDFALLLKTPLQVIRPRGTA